MYDIQLSVVGATILMTESKNSANSYRRVTIRELFNETLIKNMLSNT